jgi:hypothetical protein
MAALYGKLWGSRGTVTRTGNSSINAKLETWEGSVQVTLMRDGSFEVYTGSKSYATDRVFVGKIESSND